MSLELLLQTLLVCVEAFSVGFEKGFTHGFLETALPYFRQELTLTYVADQLGDCTASPQDAQQEAQSQEADQAMEEISDESSVSRSQDETEEIQLEYDVVEAVEEIQPGSDVVEVVVEVHAEPAVAAACEWEDVSMLQDDTSDLDNDTDSDGYVMPSLSDAGSEGVVVAFDQSDDELEGNEMPAMESADEYELGTS
eukprot:Colp12_sorted_trinity150504_noHs@611